MSLPPGLTITPKKETLTNTVLQDVCRSLAAMEQYLQSGCKKDEDSAFEYKDGNGDIQGPFNCTQLEEWNNAGYLEKKLRIRKKSTIPDIGEGAFIELQKLYDLNQPNAAFHGDPKQRAREAINCLDALLQELEQNGDSSSTGSSSSSSESVRVSVVSEAKEIKAEEADASAWSQVDDPDSGAKYWYNSVTGASQWEQP